MRVSFSFASTSVILLGIGITTYIRFILHDQTVWATDEGKYLYIIEQLRTENNVPVSGPLFVKITQWLADFFALKPIVIVPITASIISAILPFLVFICYYKALSKDIKKALISVLILLGSSYFIWPMIEGRPQQLGFFLTAIALYFFYLYLIQKSIKYITIFFILTSIIFYYHILSYLILMSVCFIIWSWFYINKQCTLFSIFTLVAPLVISVVIILVFADKNGAYLSFYYHILKFRIRSITLVHITGILSLGLIIIFRLNKQILFAIKKGTMLLRSQFVVTILIVLSISVLYMQYYLLGDLVSFFYGNSWSYFAFFQLGNISYLGFYFYGLYLLSLQNRLNNFFVISSITVLILTIFILVLSFFLRHKNLPLRLLNYWVLFAAPVCSYAFMALYKKNVNYFILLPLFITLSVILSSKNSKLFNYEHYWDKNDIEAIEWLCEQKGSFQINHTEYQLEFFSKEEVYPMLIDTLCENPPIVTINEQGCNRPVYQKGFIRICN